MKENPVWRSPAILSDSGKGYFFAPSQTELNTQQHVTLVGKAKEKNITSILFLKSLSIWIIHLGHLTPPPPPTHQKSKQKPTNK